MGPETVLQPDVGHVSMCHAMGLHPLCRAGNSEDWAAEWEDNGMTALDRAWPLSRWL